MNQKKLKKLIISACVLLALGDTAIADVFTTEEAKCPTGSRHLTFNEVYDNTETYCDYAGESQFSRLDDGATLVNSSGYCYASLQTWPESYYDASLCLKEETVIAENDSSNGNYWACIINANSSAGNTFFNLQSAINQNITNPKQLATLKLASSDSYHGTAHALAISLTNPPEDPIPYPDEKKLWNYAVFNQSGDVGALCNQAVNFLNGAASVNNKTLSASEAYLSRVSLNDHHDANPELVVWYMDLTP